MKQEILSTGIDIGTSTTQLIFSKIIIENLANAYSVPRIHIVSKEVIYRSDIYTTPILNQSQIDAGKLKIMIESEYKKAGFTPKDLSTGAVIITGDTARKQNANEVLSVLSAMAGDFVVATAGPDLESVLAAKGAGTDKLSKENGAIIANVDIGGGTSNIAVYQKGNLIATCCLDIGGRLIKVKDHKVDAVYHKILQLAKNNGLDLRIGEDIKDHKMKKIAMLMAEQIARALNLPPGSEADHFIYTNQGKPLPADLKIEGLTFSGGVADCIYGNPAEDYRFQDIGVLLGRAIKNHKAFDKVKRYQAKETIRATVVGAGTHTTTVSGSTISYAKDRLPIKNVPVLKIAVEEEKDLQAFSTRIAVKIPIFNADDDQPDPIAIAFEGQSFSSYADIKRLARAIIEGAREIIISQHPLIVIVEKDIAKVLGNALMLETGMQKDIICLDSIHAADGDYIDIGKPLAHGSVVPIIIKTLIFNT